MLICFVYRWIRTPDPARGVCEESDIDPASGFLAGWGMHAWAS